MIKGLHHNAYRCQDSEKTRAFYEDFLGLRLVSAFEIDPGATGQDTRALHTFFQMEDGSCLAFFEVPGLPFAFKEQNALDLHIAEGRRRAGTCVDRSIMASSARSIFATPTAM